MSERFLSQTLILSRRVRDRESKRKKRVCERETEILQFKQI